MKTGKVLVIAKKRFSELVEFLGEMRAFYIYLWRSGSLQTVSLFLMTTGSGVLPAADVWVLGRMINVISTWVARYTNHSQSFVSLFTTFSPWLTALILLRVGQQALSSGGQLLETYLQEQLTNVIESDILAKSARMSLIHFEDIRFQDHLLRARDGMGLGMVNFFFILREEIQVLVTVLSLVAITIRGSWLIPVVVILASGPTLWLNAKYNVDRYEMYFGHTPKNRLMQYMIRLLIERESAKEVRLFNLGPYLSRRWHALYEEVRRDVTLRARRHRLALSAVSVIPSAAFGLSLILVLHSIVYGKLLAGTAVAVVYAVQQLQQRMEAVIRGASYFHHLYLRFWTHVMAFLKLPEQPWQWEGQRQVSDESVAPVQPVVPILPGDRHSRVLVREPQVVVAEHVTFSYPGVTKPALSDITFRLKPGEKIALLGENGAGKSTLVKLLLGLHEATAGAIRFGDVDIRAIDRDSLWTHVSVVLQDFGKFHLSARENIGFGNVAEMDSGEAVRKAAGYGGAAEFIQSWPDEYSTMLGPTFGGRDLSGGQWQKVATSRGFMREPYFLILDEPTAALDPLAEVEVYRRFQQLAGHRTALLISHRIGFARLADRVFVLKDGRLIETGTHEELVRHGGEYHKLLEIQSQWYR